MSRSSSPLIAKCSRRRNHRGLVGLLIALLLSTALPLRAQTELDRARAGMSDPAHPLLAISTARGSFHVELFPDSAPESVAWFRDAAGHYEGNAFGDVLPGVLFRSNGPAPEELPEELLESRPAPEINHEMLGLAQQTVLNPDGTAHPWLNITDRQRFESDVLRPLYRGMEISGPEQLAERRDEVIERLRELSLADLFRLQGYPDPGELPSRAPRTGSVLLLAETPQRSSPRIAITLTDTPWLRGRHTVIGQVVGSLSVPRALGSEPRSGTPPAVIYRIEELSDNADTGGPLSGPAP